MECRVLMVLVTLCFVPVVVSRSKGLSKLQSEALSKTRCDLTCLEVSREARTKCRNKCRSEEQKPGSCPAVEGSKWARACVEACNSDAQCEGTDKCCKQGCSLSCSRPTDLLTLPGLPAVPTIEVQERRRFTTIKWSDGVGDLARAVPGPILYLLEEQHHLGPKFEEARLGQWNILRRTKKNKISLRNILKPGHWYRFRVAAVSASGTRGFSEPSTPFTPRKGPRPPPPPKKLKARQVKMENGTATVKLEWKEPKSDLPIIRYKVFWSRRVRGLSGELDSVLVSHQTVPKTQNSIDITGLRANSMYFLQVQTISQFGTTKLRSEKAAVFYNTTGNSDTNDRPPEALTKKMKLIKGMKLLNINMIRNAIKAKISWEPSRERKTPSYYVHWKAIKCGKSNKLLAKEMTASTTENNFEIYELSFDCSYRVSVNESRKSRSQDSSMVVSVPACEYFQKKTTEPLNCPT